MTAALHPICYADRAIHQSVEVIENVQLAHDTWRIRLACPEMAQVSARPVSHDASVRQRRSLARAPLALYDTALGADGEPLGIDVVYLTLGKMTTRLARSGRGQGIEIWGPLGNGFPSDPVEHLILVAGGIGQTPFMALAQECLGRRQYGDPRRTAAKIDRVTLCYGARRQEYLAAVDDFQRLRVDVRISTDDGSAGHHGLVTDLLRATLAEGGGNQAGRRIICCGPERMLEAVARIAVETSTPCLASLETPMACGIGICFSCVAKLRDDAGGWDYRRTCVEGPVFDAAHIEW